MPNCVAVQCLAGSATSGSAEICERKVFPPSTLPPQPLQAYPPEVQESLRRVRERYRELYSLPVVEYPDGSRSFHDAVLLRCQGVNLLFLKGDLVEMAFQHGRLLADQIAIGAIPQSSKLVANLVANAIGSRGHLQKLITKGVQRYVGNAILRSSLRKSQLTGGPEEALDEVAALSDACGVSLNSFIDAVLAPETIMVLAALSRQGLMTGWRLWKGIATGSANCSSFAAWGSATLDGQLLIGRNMDYPLNGYFDRFPTVSYFQPKSGQLPYMSFTSAGVHNCGLTACNAAGVFLSSHVVPCTDASVEGVLALSIANHVTRTARSFEEAIELFRIVRPPTGWSFLIISSNEGRVGTVELSSNRVAVRESSGDCHVQTNRFLTSAMRGTNLSLNRSVDEDADARYQRIEQLLGEQRGRLDVSAAMSILADQVDPAVNQIRGLGNTVAVHTTMTSLVLRPAAGFAYVATGQAPAAHSEFIEIPLIGRFADPASFPTRVSMLDNSDFPKTHAQIWKGLQLFIRAKSAYENENDVARAYALLEETVQCDPSNPAYHFQLGIFALKNQRFADACQAFDGVFSAPYATQQLRRLALYYRGRTCAHLGQTSAAIRDLSEITSDETADDRLLDAAKTALQRTRSRGSCRLRQKSLLIMMQQSDMVRY